MISVIICTYNRDKYIYDSLRSIVENDYPSTKYEIVLVNNNSTDNTESECRRFETDYPQAGFHYFTETNQGLSFARNRGILEAKGEVLIFIDDDAFIEKNYLSKLERLLSKNPEIKAFGGKVTPVFESGMTPEWLSYWLYPIISGVDKGNKISAFKRKSYPVGANMGFYRNCLESGISFNTKLGRTKKNLIGGEEKELFNSLRKNGIQIFYFPIEVKHMIPESRTTIDYIRKFGHGVGVSERILRVSSGKSVVVSCLFELIKWGISLFIWIFYAVSFKIIKGNSIILFRFYVTKGLLGK